MKSRKGFTLIELLIVIVLIGVLASAMTLSLGSATASAKAASIIRNIEACKTAANLYYADNYNKSEVAKAMPEEAFLYDGSKYLTNWKYFDDSNNSEASIKYSSGGEGYQNWWVAVDFSDDGVSRDIAAALGNSVLYSALSDDEAGVDVATTGKFSVILYNSSTDINIPN